MILLTDGDLQDKDWVPQTGLNVNPIPADAFIASHTPTGQLKVTNISSASMGGALVTCKRPYIPAFGPYPLPYIQVKKDYFVSSSDMYNLGRKEFDLKICFKSGTTTPCANVGNFSTQVNGDTGLWQLDPTGTKWVDTTFKPLMTPDKWVSVIYNFILDTVKATWGVLSVNWGGQAFTVPGQFQNVPAMTTNWAIVAALQAQTEVFKPGSLTTEYDNVSIAYSDTAF